MTGFLKANYHTHTYRCQHAYGSEREYIEAAIRMGIAELGFSDHVPCPFKDGWCCAGHPDDDGAGTGVCVCHQGAWGRSMHPT